MPRGQQPFRAGLVVGEARPPDRGWTPHHGHPMQMMIAVFDFPAHAQAGAHASHVPALHVDHVAEA